MTTPGIVTFDPATFIADFPAFASVSTTMLTNNFNFATLQLDNSYNSVVEDEPTRAALLNLLTAHITALLNGVNGQAATGVVGRVSDATQGSVSVSAQFDAKGFGESYYLQTPWGAMYWQSTARYRTGRYIRACGHDTASAWDAWPQ